MFESWLKPYQYLKLEQLQKVLKTIHQENLLRLKYSSWQQVVFFRIMLKTYLTHEIIFILIIICCLKHNRVTCETAWDMFSVKKPLNQKTIFGHVAPACDVYLKVRTES